jgi:hypothetical protein
MNNPWENFYLESPYLLSSDYRHVMSFNSTVGEDYKIHVELLPEPFLGNPDAPIFLLNLNPGYSELDLPFHEQSQYQEMWQKNILHQLQEYPFFLLHPSVSNESGPRWWAQKLKEPVEFAGRKVVANSFCCVEYFPYHSRKFRAGKTILDSQRYNFYLVEKAVVRNCLIVCMRGRKLWFDAVPVLKDYGSLFQLKSVQNVSISRKNCPDGFPAVEKALRIQKENQ